MAIITLGNRPKNFKKSVTVQMLDGTPGTIPCIFKYRTSTEYGELVDSLQAEHSTAGVTADTATEAEPDFSLKKILEGKREKNGEFLMHIIEGWGLDVAFSKTTAQQLCDELPGAATEIFDTYRIAIVEGRLGN